MKKTFDQSKDEIAKLCHYFEINRKSFFAPGVKEAHVRQSLIDPFFENLGWDVRNINKTAPQYREVIPEDSLDIEGHQKAPDYTFRVGTLPKFYAEAKKCGVNINIDLGPAYQLRRYAFSAKLALSILTDFEELSIYECSSRPKPSDKASHSRILYFRFDEYPDNWRAIWDIFSREAVWSGSFDQYISSKRKRGTSEVDTEFLKDIEHWREELARNLALRNGNLSVEELNSSVQLIIDRIVFLRMAEDRGLEPYQQLLKLCEQPDIYRNFITMLCRKADEKYNSGLFHFHKEAGIVDAPDTITPRLDIDDKIIKPIIQNLYFEFGSPYHFGVLPVEILGTVYERFLGKVIRLTAGHQAKVEEKPEVRKAGGVYYTPSYIVDYIVKNTVGKQVEGKSPAQLAGSKVGQPKRVLDMACGSGSFLLGAYQYLLDHCLKWYENNQPEKHNKAVFQDIKGIWRLTISERKRILTTHIFGVDIDRQAVEVTKLSLLIKALEGENDASLSQQMQIFQERALPNLSNNIKCGNSLIGPDYFAGKLFPDAEELNRINPFDWKAEFPEAVEAGGFDCVIGNPPYGARISEDESQFLRESYETATKDLDTYSLFIEKAIKLCKPMGCVSMIVPTGWYSGPKFQTLRRFVASETDPEVFINLPYDIFDAWVDTSIFVVVIRSQKAPWPRKESCEVRLRTFPKRHSIISAEEFEIQLLIAEMIDWFNTGNDEFLTYADKKSTLLIQKIKANSKSLGEISDVQRGVTPFELSKSKTHSNSRLAFNGTVRRYILDKGPSRYIRFDDTLAEYKPERYFIGPRLLLRELISRQFRLQAAKATTNFITNKSMQTILQLKGTPELNYLLGLINSRLMSWYFLSLSNVGQRDDFPKIVLKETRSLPIRLIDSSSATDRIISDKIQTLVDQMLDLHKRKAAAADIAGQERLQRLIDSTDKKIDALVYELYGLTQEEIEIVEAATNNN